MRFRHFVVGFLAVLSFCLTRSAWSQLTYTVLVVDKSDLGSPLKISGTASFTELIVANSVKSSSSFKVDARNVCEKAIILVLAYFDEAGPHGGGTHQVSLTTSSGAILRPECRSCSHAAVREDEHRRTR